MAHLCSGGRGGAAGVPVLLAGTIVPPALSLLHQVLGFEVATESPGDPSDPACAAPLYGGAVFATNVILFGVPPGSDAFVAELDD